MKNALLITIAALVLSACTQNSGTTFNQNVSGRNGEVLFVINNDIKADTAGRFLIDLFTDDFVGLPSSEPLFDVQTVPHAYFDKMMHTFRNIVDVQVADTVQTPSVQFFTDVWARQQAMASVRARNKAELLQLLDDEALRILSFFTKQERDRLIQFNRRTRHLPLSEKILKQWGVDVVVPNSFSECKSPDPKHMQWMMIDADEYQSGLVIYEFPYTGEASISKENLIAHRDSILHANIEGPANSHMLTETRFGLDDIILKAGRQNGLYVVELRGLWRMDGYAMGGPFLLRAYVDEAKGRVIVTDGYVYYPARDRKRNIIRQLEAVMYTLKLPDKEQDNTK